MQSQSQSKPPVFPVHYCLTAGEGRRFFRDTDADMKPKCWSHPKFTDLQMRLNVGPAYAAGILEGLWHLAATFSEQFGMIPNSPKQLESWLRTGIEPETLVGHLVDCGWLDERDDGLYIHDWQDHRPNYVNDRLRMRNVREQSRTVPRRAPACPPSYSASAYKEPTVPNLPDVGRNGYSTQFEIWWVAYPRKGRTDKKKAAKSFAAALKVVDIDQLMAATHAYARSPKVLEGTYVKHATTWLNGGCWDDDREAWKASGGKPGAQAESTFAQRLAEAKEEQRQRELQGDY